MFFSDLGVLPNLISGAEREQNAEEGEGPRDGKMKAVGDEK